MRHTPIASLPGAGDRTATSSTRKKIPVRSLERLLGSRSKREAVHVLTGGAKRCMMVHYRHVGEPLASLAGVGVLSWHGPKSSAPDPTADDEKTLWKAGTAGRLDGWTAGTASRGCRRNKRTSLPPTRGGPKEIDSLERRMRRTPPSPGHGQASNPCPGGCRIWPHEAVASSLTGSFWTVLLSGVVTGKTEVFPPISRSCFDEKRPCCWFLLLTDILCRLAAMPRLIGCRPDREEHGGAVLPRRHDGGHGESCTVSLPGPWAFSSLGSQQTNPSANGRERERERAAAGSQLPEPDPIPGTKLAARRRRKKVGCAYRVDGRFFSTAANRGQAKGGLSDCVPSAAGAATPGKAR